MSIYDGIILILMYIYEFIEYVILCIKIKQHKVQKYLDSLPDDTKRIVIQKYELPYLPDLSRFKKLEILICNNGNLIELSENLPKSLTYIDCGANLIKKLPKNLPPFLEYLRCYDNRLTELPENLPNTLITLDVSYNNIYKIFETNNAPIYLTYFDCSYNNLTKLPDWLPDSLIYFNCSHNILNLFPEILPNNINYIICGYNKLIRLPDIWPQNLKYLSCYQTTLLNNYPELKDHQNNLEYVKKRSEKFIFERNIKRNSSFKMELIEFWIKKQYHPTIYFD